MFDDVHLQTVDSDISLEKILIKQTLKKVTCTKWELNVLCILHCNNVNEPVQVLLATARVMEMYKR